METQVQGDEDVERTEDDIADGIASFNKASVGDVPIIREPDPGQVTLLFGLLDKSGTPQKVAQVRELRGSDEEALARINGARDDYYPMLEDMIIRRATDSIGSVNVQADPSVLGPLLVADRGLLFAQIMFATYGTVKTYEEMECPVCHQLNDFNVNIEDLLKINPVPNDENGLPTCQTTVSLSKNRSVVLHFPTGEDQLYVWQFKKGANDAERATLQIQRCIDLLDGRKVPDPHKFALNLSMPDRRKILQAIDKGPGVSFEEVEVPCTSCSQSLPFVFGWASLLSI